MEISLSEDQIKRLIVAELHGNLEILIDPKQKDSFSEGRIKVWTDIVSKRLFYHLTEQHKHEPITRINPDRIDQ